MRHGRPRLPALAPHDKPNKTTTVSTELAVPRGSAHPPHTAAATLFGGGRAGQSEMEVIEEKV